MAKIGNSKDLYDRMCGLLAEVDSCEDLEEECGDLLVRAIDLLENICTEVNTVEERSAHAVKYIDELRAGDAIECASSSDYGSFLETIRRGLTD